LERVADFDRLATALRVTLVLGLAFVFWFSVRPGLAFRLWNSSGDGLADIHHGVQPFSGSHLQSGSQDFFGTHWSSGSQADDGQQSNYGFHFHIGALFSVRVSRTSWLARPQRVSIFYFGSQSSRGFQDSYGSLGFPGLIRLVARLPCLELISIPARSLRSGFQHELGSQCMFGVHLRNGS
jgi:hypothetical protein